MLGRKDYTQEELEAARTAIDRQLAAYDELAGGAGALEAFEPLFFNNMTLALDRYFVHRVRAVAGKDGNPLNEVELLAESLLTGDGVLHGSNAIKYKPDESVLGLEIGDPIRIDREQFGRLYEAFVAELRARFVDAG
jgi:hypothetical protein